MVNTSYSTETLITTIIVEIYSQNTTNFLNVKIYKLVAAVTNNTTVSAWIDKLFDELEKAIKIGKSACQDDAPAALWSRGRPYQSVDEVEQLMHYRRAQRKPYHTSKKTN